MNIVNFRNQKTPQLVQEFIATAKQRGLFILNSETRRANRMYDRMKAIDDILRERGIAARLELAPLLDNEDRFVRYYAAVYLLGLLSARARAVIEKIANLKYDALAGHAGMLLAGLDSGEYRPD